MTKRVLLLGYGYIGQALGSHLRGLGHEIKTVDYSTVDLEDYNSLRTSLLNSFDCIILTAGHSSVLQAVNSGPHTTFSNNVIKFSRLASKYENGKLLYISSASVYGSTGSTPVKESHVLPEPANIYDWSKQMLDRTAAFVAPDAVGLRLGTVCGHSPNQRLDLMIPKMVYAAKTDKKVIVNNQENWRAILGMHDLCSAVGTIIEAEKWVPGIFNLSSFNMRIGHIAAAVARSMEVEVEVTEDNNTYSFALLCDKVTAKYGWYPKQGLQDIIKDCQKNIVPSKEDLYRYIRE